jgi:NAD(P)-dependent dehydrogenase (short-subunit alcohol dehydrogenase family)
MLKNDDEHKGVIINVSSVSSLRGAVSGASYGTAKAALNALSRNTAWTYRNKGIRCNSILPGGVDSGIIRNSKSRYDPTDTKKEYHQQLMHACAVGMVSCLDVAESIVYLIEAKGVNGEELVIDRGWMMA